MVPRRRTRATAATRVRATAAMAAVATTVVVGAVATAGCTTTGSNATGDNGYVSGDGTISVIDPADREGAPTIAGDKLGGGSLDTADLTGKTVVINVWGSWCGECRAEAADLVEAANTLDSSSDGSVAFVGLDTRDLDASALSYQRHFDVPYPSLVDQDGSLLLAFYQVVSPHAIPSTLVIDSDGKLAVVINGPTTTSTMVDLVEDVQKSTG